MTKVSGYILESERGISCSDSLILEKTDYPFSEILLNLTCFIIAIPLEVIIQLFAGLVGVVLVHLKTGAYPGVLKLINTLGHLNMVVDKLRELLLEVVHGLVELLCLSGSVTLRLLHFPESVLHLSGGNIKLGHRGAQFTKGRVNGIGGLAGLLTHILVARNGVHHHSNKGRKDSSRGLSGHIEGREDGGLLLLVRNTDFLKGIVGRKEDIQCGKIGLLHKVETVLYGHKAVRSPRYGVHRQHSGVVRADVRNDATKKPKPPLVVGEKVGYPCDDALNGAGVLVANPRKHNLPGILEVGDFTLYGFSQDLLHIVELTASRSHSVEGFLHHLEGNLAGGDSVEHLADGNSPALNLLELISKLLEDRDTGLCELTDLLAAQELRASNLPVGKNDAAHIYAETGRHIRQLPRGLVDLIHRNGEGCQLLSIRSQVLEGVRGPDGKDLELAENLVSRSRILQDCSQCGVLGLELARYAHHITHDTCGAEYGRVLGNHRGKPAHYAVLADKLAGSKRNSLSGVTLGGLTPTGHSLLLVLNVKLFFHSRELLVPLLKDGLVGGYDLPELLEFGFRDGASSLLRLKLLTGKKRHLFLGLRFTLGGILKALLGKLKKPRCVYRFLDGLFEILCHSLHALHPLLELI